MSVQLGATSWQTTQKPLFILQNCANLTITRPARIFISSQTIPLLTITSTFLHLRSQPDQGYLIFTSYRSGKPNFFKLAFPDGDIVQLTDADDIHGYSGVISKDGTELFYTELGTIKAIHLDTFAERVLAKFPDGSLGECSVSADETIYRDSDEARRQIAHYRDGY